MVHRDEEPDFDSSEKPCNQSARRRVDAYHEALRERHALRELEQPFILDKALRGLGRRSRDRHA